MDILEANGGPNFGKDSIEITIVKDTALQPETSLLGSGADAYEEDSDDISIYVVREGDTIKSIAAMYDVTPETVAWANDLNKNDKLQSGKVLAILPISGIKHTTAKGETIQSIARKYKGDIHEIAQYNGIAEDSVLALGQEVIIPSGEIDAPAEKKADSKKDTTAKKDTKLAQKGKKVIKNLRSISGYFIRPTTGQMTQRLHDRYAVDIGSPTGTPIVAAAAGVVDFVNAGGYGGGYGSYVIIQHPNGTKTLYAHMSRVATSRGESVAQGQVIGYVGSTGRSTGPHLHFEVRGASNPLASYAVGTKI